MDYLAVKKDIGVTYSLFIYIYIYIWMILKLDLITKVCVRWIMTFVYNIIFLLSFIFKNEIVW